MKTTNKEIIIVSIRPLPTTTNIIAKIILTIKTKLTTISTLSTGTEKTALIKAIVIKDILHKCNPDTQQVVDIA